MARLKDRALIFSLTPLIPILFSERGFGSLLYRVAKGFAPDEGGESVVKRFANMWASRESGGLLIRRMLRQTNRRCKKQFVANMLMRQFWRGAKQRDEIMAREGIKPPFNILISPTMRCNLRCVGCYAAHYSTKDDLELDLVSRVVSECKNLGIHFVTILGGEPFIRSDMWKVYRMHSDVIFQVFTNGTLIDSEATRWLCHLGNIFPIFSVEGFEQETDTRRGKGTFRKVMAAMDNLRGAGVLFGFSSMLTRQNLETVISDDFNDMLIDKGCVFGWHFLYIPVGRDADPDLMPTPQQRARLAVDGAVRIRREKPILVCDFWSDAPHAGGCIAGGRYYLHINANGDVEPCIFVHFAADNIKDKSLWEVLQSPFFKAIRARQPYHHNLLRPCMIIDHPTVLREVCAETKPYSTHPGSESVVTTLCGALDQYASGVASELEQPWQSNYVERGFVPTAKL